MFGRGRARHRIKWKLIGFLQPYAWPSWYDRDRRCPTPRDALVGFRQLLSRYRPDSFYRETESLHHFDFLRYLLPIHLALEKGEYRRACRELISLLHDEDFFQPRVYWSVLLTLDRHLQGGAKGCWGSS